MEAKSSRLMVASPSRSVKLRTPTGYRGMIASFFRTGTCTSVTVEMIE
jgi:hypothetical protein